MVPLMPRASAAAMKEREAEVEAYCLAQVSRREQTAAPHFVPASLRHGKAARAAPGRPYMVCILGMAEEASIAGRAVRMPHARMPACRGMCRTE
jgi:hypothetical protein